MPLKIFGEEMIPKRFDSHAASANRRIGVPIEDASAPSTRIGLSSDAVALVTALVTVLILLAPTSYRDLLFASAVFMYLSLSLLDFKSVWINFLYLLPFVHLGYEVWGQSKFDMLRVLLIGLAVVFLLQKRRPTFWAELRGSHGLVGYLLFVLANVLSSINAGNVEATYRSLLYLAPAMFYVLSASVVDDDPVVYKRLLRSLCSAAVIVAMFALVEMAIGRSVVLAMGIPYPKDLDVYLAENRFGITGRIVSITGHPSFTGLYFVLLLVLCIGYSVLYRPRARFLPLALLAIGSFLVLITGMRAALLAYLVVGLCFPLTQRGKWVHFAAIVVLSVALGSGGAAVFPQLPAYLTESVQVESGAEASANITARVSLSAALLDVFRENLLLGYGPGLIQKQGLSGEVPDWESLTGLENHYAVILADGGLLAAFAYLLFMIGVVRDCRRAGKSTDRTIRVGGQIVFLAFIAYFVVSASITPITLVANYVLMAIYGATMARVDAHSRARTAGFASNRSPTPERVVARAS